MIVPAAGCSTLEYYRYLNGGYRLPLVGGTDKMSSEVPVGLYRTYAHLGDEDVLVRGLVPRRARRPDVPERRADPRVPVDGHEIGDTVRLSGPGTVTRRGDRGERAPDGVAAARPER